MRKYPKIVEGDKYHRLTAIRFDHKSPSNNMSYWLFKCDCGKEVITRLAEVVSGRYKSCGCYSRDYAKEHATERFTKHGGYGTRLYKIWARMKQRTSTPGYKYWYDMGVRMCDEWKNSFIPFRDWALSHGYRDDLTIDRIDPNGDYTPDNCRWATYHEQRVNQRPRTKEQRMTSKPIEWHKEQFKKEKQQVLNNLTIDGIIKLLRYQHQIDSAINEGRVRFERNKYLRHETKGKGYWSNLTKDEMNKQCKECFDNIKRNMKVTNDG